MELSILLVPVLAGYWVLLKTRLFRSRVFRLSGYHLFFHAGLVGICLLIGAWLIVPIFAWLISPILAWIISLILSWIPSSESWFTYDSLFEHFDIIAFSCLLAIGAPLAINKWAPHWIDQGEWDKKQAREYGNLIDLLIYEAWEAESMVEITTKYGKSYIGLTEKSDFRVADESDVSVFPLMSGYRHPENKELIVTTHYGPTILECVKRDGKLRHLAPRDFKIVLPHREIASARLFDAKAYIHFQQESQD